MPSPIPGELTNGEANAVVGMLAGLPAERVITWALVAITSQEGCDCGGCTGTAVVAPYLDALPVANILSTGIVHVTLVRTGAAPVIATIGSSPQVRCYASHADAITNADHVDRRVNIISEGPPGTVSAWGMAEGKYWLVRKMPQARLDKDPKIPRLYSVEGDRGEK